MDIQVLNEIANQARQTLSSQVKASIAANAQLKALKGSPVPASGNPASALEDSPDQIQESVAPEISTVARAASAYSVVVEGELNSDELRAIQDLSGRIRTAVSDFLSQPGLEQVENIAAVSASSPEAVQELTDNVEQAVVAALNLPAVESEVIVNAVPPTADLPEEIPAPENFISLERVTQGAESNHPAQVVAVNPEAGNVRGSENTPVENPVVVEGSPESSRGDFRVAAAPAVPNRSTDTNVQKDVPVPPVSPALSNAEASEEVPVETPVNRTSVVPQQESVNRPETSEADPQVSPVVPESPAVPNRSTDTNVQKDVPVPPASPVLSNAEASEEVPVETPVNRATVVPQQEPATRPETAEADFQDSPVVPESPAVPNRSIDTNVPKEVPVPLASPVLSNTQTSTNATVETRESRPIVTKRQEPVGRPGIEADQQEVPGIAVRPELQNALVQNDPSGNPVIIPASPVDQGRGVGKTPVQIVNPLETTAPPAGEGSQAVSGSPDPQPVSSPPQPRTASSSDLFAQERATVNPENIRNANELVGSVVSSEFSAEAKKIFSEPKVIRTVAELADFILERLKEIIAAKQQQPLSSDGIGIS